MLNSKTDTYADTVCHQGFFVLLFHVFTRLKHLDDMMSSACLLGEAVYKVLYWDDHVKSSRSVSSHTDCVSYQCLRARWHLQYFSTGSLEGCYYWFACFMSLLWAACLLDSTALSSCGTETSAEVRTSRLEEALPNSLELFRKSIKLKNGCISRVPLVLMDLRKMFHVGPSQVSETVCEEQEQINLLDSTPTPTSLEVRGAYTLLYWLQKDSFMAREGTKEWQFICF